MADDRPRVEGGLLNKPFPIKTRGDVNRARVLPAVKAGAPARPSSEPRAAERPSLRTSESERPQGAFDYVKKRNELMRSNGRSMSGRR